MRKMFVTMGLAVLLATPAMAQDQDGDGVPDGEDNCLLVANPDQINDTQPPDAYGNACDGDFTGDGAVGGSDFALFRGCLAQNAQDEPWDLVCDMDGNRFLSNRDYRLFKRSFRLAKPGPSGLLP